MLKIRRSVPKGDDPAQWPVPPPELMEYGESPAAHLDDGRIVYETMRHNCTSEGMQVDSAERVLDFGCSNGRILRWFANPINRSLGGCDVNADQVFWALENLIPPLRLFVNDPSPHLPCRDGSFDLIYAIAIYTHLKQNHIGWLCEAQRLLDTNGVLYITVHDEIAFAQPEATKVVARYFGGWESIGELDDVRYLAINDQETVRSRKCICHANMLRRSCPGTLNCSACFPGG